jgi:hypothetical protein
MTSSGDSVLRLVARRGGRRHLAVWPRAPCRHKCPCRTNAPREYITEHSYSTLQVKCLSRTKNTWQQFARALALDFLSRGAPRRAWNVRSKIALSTNTKVYTNNNIYIKYTATFVGAYWHCITPSSRENEGSS